MLAASTSSESGQSEFHQEMLFVVCCADADVADVVVIGLANLFYSLSRSLKSRPIRGVSISSE